MEQPFYSSLCSFIDQFVNSLIYQVTEKNREQAGAELGQAQPKLG